VADGVLLCEDALVPAEVLVRREALRDGRSDEPMSVTELAIECRLACLRFCGVVGTRGAPSGAVGLAARGTVSSGGVVRVWDCDWDCDWVWVWEREERPGLWPLEPLPPKKEGRREKRPVEFDVVEGAWSAICCIPLSRAINQGARAVGT
jgi:hypothetical protein